MEVQIQRTRPLHVAALRFDGPLDEVAPIFERMQAWAEREGLPAAPLVGVFIEETQPLNEFGKPHGAAIGHAEAWLEIPDDVAAPQGDETPELHDAVPVDVAVARYQGNPEDILRFSDQLRRFLRRRGYRPTSETRHVYRRTDWDDVSAWDVEVQVVLEAA